MFIKPFKVKSNNQLKGSERRKLCEEILQAFPKLKDDEVQNLFKKKDAITVMKVVTHNGNTVKVYCTAKVPLFLHFDSPNLQGYFPTIYTLWQYPDLMYNFTTRSMVISKLSSGADLMIPGLVLDGPATLYSFGKMKKRSPVSVNTDDNRAPFAVGISALSSEDMYMSGGRGKCVEIIHVMGDSICQLLDKPLIRPELGKYITTFNSSVDSITDELKQESLSEKVADSSKESEKLPDNDLQMRLPLNVDSLQIEDTCSEKTSPLEENSNKILEDDNESEEIEEQQPLDPVQEMDKLLEYCFLKACKTSIKKGDLPMLTSNFFKNHVMAVCPPGQSLDIKKSSHKKLSVFLSKMKEMGLVDTSVLKGVESLLAIKTNHPLLQGLVVKEEIPIKQPEISNAPVIAECYKVTAYVVPLLSQFGFEKGDIMKRADIRKCFTDYVKKENLQNGKIIKINPQLAGILKTKENQETLTMEDGINKFIGKMTHTHGVTVGGTTSFFTGKLEPIEITVATRTNNKKVTLVNNLETFGIKMEEFSKECQGIGASATVTDIPGKKTPSVLVQGNQVLYVYKLLTEKYQINKNYIKGIEFAPKKKK